MYTLAEEVTFDVLDPQNQASVVQSVPRYYDLRWRY